MNTGSASILYTSPMGKFSNVIDVEKWMNNGYRIWTYKI
jgi:hypothetical protein